LVWQILRISEEVLAVETDPNPIPVSRSTTLPLIGPLATTKQILNRDSFFQTQIPSVESLKQQVNMRKYSQIHLLNSLSFFFLKGLPNLIHASSSIHPVTMAREEHQECNVSSSFIYRQIIKWKLCCIVELVTV